MAVQKQRHRFRRGKRLSRATFRQGGIWISDVRHGGCCAETLLPPPVYRFWEEPQRANLAAAAERFAFFRRPRRFPLGGSFQAFALLAVLGREGGPNECCGRVRGE